MAEELQVFVKWVEFLKWLLNTTEKFPKMIRFTITSRIDNLALDILEIIIVCKYDRDARAKGLRRINIGIEKLRVLLRICHELKYLSPRQYQFAALHINESGKMIWGWLKKKNKNEK
ncbi:MAG: diversity-generating retroelement protein Avd [Candidatus Aminicenantes bacterium]|nr:diversity-generating retroelement protein Avd [Candidatus Aminicenantes bacterium]NIM79720.1 diversity-generating retroelement protein Avd [Candidatus Aminicenantes bacterium]NIN17263.1 diversity-generating retroelement protein Avd [Candidatus Aminicenantes bacterium]NIN41132.1 diversity-generating retroelement protein Avd [Candidatus Aminicenantes bacterium]NIN85696.1 diversity-generating retroelement protein Avd [Candidatus Aminicenantes bacterium]